MTNFFCIPVDNRGAYYEVSDDLINKFIYSSKVRDHIFIELQY